MYQNGARFLLVPSRGLVGNPETGTLPPGALCAVRYGKRGAVGIDFSTFNPVALDVLRNATEIVATRKFDGSAMMLAEESAPTPTLDCIVSSTGQNASSTVCLPLHHPPYRGAAPTTG